MEKYSSRAPITSHKICWNPEDLPGGCWGKEQSIKTIVNSARGIPTALVLTPLDLIDKIAALVPPPARATAVGGGGDGTGP